MATDPNYHSRLKISASFPVTSILYTGRTLYEVHQHKTHLQDFGQKAKKASDWLGKQQERVNAARLQSENLLREVITVLNKEKAIFADREARIVVSEEEKEVIDVAFSKLTKSLNENISGLKEICSNSKR